MKYITAIVLMAVLVLAYGCAQKAIPESQYPAADEKAENILQGISKEDYAMLSRDLSETLKQSTDAEYFSRLSKFIKENSGEYVSKSLAASKDENSMHTRGYDCQFSMESVYFTITFNADYSKVEGIYFDSENMRKALE
ncbi:MAG TPA: DUF3887 domain-containing protein [Nanoarchaeota archaeon]|nr:DUF3887 domain-containing protein [Nanoarchaeota archaeon]